MFKMKIRALGNRAAIVLPKDVLARLKVVKGDWVVLAECPGGFQIKPYDPDYERQMEAAREVMREQRDVLQELAKIDSKGRPTQSDHSMKVD